MKHAWLAAVVLLASQAAWAGSPGQWLYPSAGSANSHAPSNDHAQRSLPGSPAHFSDAQIDDMEGAVDWWPAEHPEPPASVMHGQGEAYACGYCHLPNGGGRPENAALAGLPADYIRRQVADFASGARAGPPGARPTEYMVGVAKAAKGSAVAGAADYFSRLRFTSRVRVIEADRVPPHTAEAFVFHLRKGPAVPLGEQIVEGPSSMERFEARDPHVEILAYVPTGAIAQGAALARSGGPAGQPCASCHGADLHGGLGPPLAGRSPTYVARQLFAFQGGLRSNPEAAPMRQVSAKLTTRQIIDLAAYAGSLKP